MEPFLRPALTALIAAAQPAPAPAKAPTNPRSTVGEVVVLGQKQAKPPSFSSAVSSYVRAHGQPGPLGQLTRWMEPICPTVEGLSDAYAEFVSQRISEIAVRIGAPRPGRCRHGNVLVVFTPTPQALMDAVRAKRPELLGYDYAAHAAQLATFHGPTEAWYITATTGFTGQSYTDTRDGRMPPGRAGSHLENGMTSQVIFALVVVDADQVTDRPIGTIADHIAMLVLTKAAPRSGCGPLPSILDALDPSCPGSATAQTLTPYDEAYLKALYASNPAELLSLQRGGIAHSIAKQTAPH